MKYDKEYIKKLNELKKRRFAMQSLITLKLAYPYILDTGIVVGILSLIGATPFYRDKTNVSLQTAKTINSLGNDKSVNLFTGENLKKDGQVIYYSKWNQNDEGYFERDIKKYDIIQHFTTFFSLLITFFSILDIYDWDIPSLSATSFCVNSSYPLKPYLSCIIVFSLSSNISESD